MAHAFKDRTTFNENINAWDVSNVTNMRMPCLEMLEFLIRILVIGIFLISYKYGIMFFGAKSFNQPIGAWDTSNVVNYERNVLEAFVFNQADWRLEHIFGHGNESYIQGHCF